MTIQKSDICFDPSYDFFFFIITVEIAVKTPGKLMSNISWDGTPPDRTQYGMELVDYQEEMQNERHLYS